MANRNEKSSEEAISEIRAKLSQEALKLGDASGIKHGDLDFVQLDLSSLESVKKCAYTLLNKYPFIHILINNAGEYIFFLHIIYPLGIFVGILILPCSLNLKVKEDILGGSFIFNLCSLKPFLKIRNYGLRTRSHKRRNRTANGHKSHRPLFTDLYASPKID